MLSKYPHRPVQTFCLPTVVGQLAFLDNTPDETCACPRARTLNVAISAASLGTVVSLMCVLSQVKEEVAIEVDDTPPGDKKKLDKPMLASYQPQNVEAAWDLWWAQSGYCKYVSPLCA